MDFKKWMIKEGLSQSSAEKYESAIKGSISGWALKAGITDEPLTNFHSIHQLHTVEDPIRELSIFQERNTVGNNMYSSALKRFREYLENTSESIEKDLDEIFSDDKLSETVRKSLVKSRIGQGEFRKKLISKWRGCTITGYKDVTLLRASHIKPWRKSNDDERLNVYNGFLLLPNLDKAFDSGFITFRKSGKIQVSEHFDNPTLFGISPQMSVELEKEHQVFLEFHRDIVFKR